MLPNSKHFVELSCFCLENFKEEGGGPDSKDDEEQFLLWLGHFSSKIGEDDQNLNTFKEHKFVKNRVLKNFLK